MRGKRKRSPPAFKARVALTNFKGDRTANAQVLVFGAHATQIGARKNPAPCRSTVPDTLSDPTVPDTLSDPPCLTLTPCLTQSNIVRCKK